MSDELKPCPFCGGDKARTIFIRDGRKVACICGACGKPEFYGPLDRPDAERRAITAWNTRAPQPTAEAMREAWDWRVVAKLAGEHGIRYRTNSALVAFITAIRAMPLPEAPKSGMVERPFAHCCAEGGGNPEYCDCINKNHGTAFFKTPEGQSDE